MDPYEDKDPFEFRLRDLARHPGFTNWALRHEAARAKYIDKIEAHVGDHLGSEGINVDYLKSIVNQKLLRELHPELVVLGFVHRSTPDLPAAIREDICNVHLLRRVFDESESVLEVMASERPEEFLALLNRGLARSGTALATILPALMLIGVRDALGPFEAHPLWASLTK